MNREVLCRRNPFSQKSSTTKSNKMNHHGHSNNGRRTLESFFESSTREVLSARISWNSVLRRRQGGRLHCYGALRLVFFIVCLTILTTTTNGLEKASEDLYKLLGVSRKATTKEIKRAYRRKALESHPDKNTDVSKEEAAEAFQKVVHAFEVLSDENTRRIYDRTGKTNGATSTNSGGGGGYGFSGGFQFTWTYSSHGGGRRYQQQYRRPKLKDRFDVQEAQSRVLHVVSLEQLKTIILDDDNTQEDVLERNLLICFTTPKLEEHVNDEMVYPYPFAAKSAQGIWWEDLLQTSMVRYHRENELTRFFDIPHGDTLEKPVFLFGKRGDPFVASSFNRLETNDRKEFEDWMWTQIKVEVVFVNKHPHPVEIYWLHGNTGRQPIILQPDERHYHFTHLSHEFWVRDARTDTRKDSPGRWKLADNTCLTKWKILNDEQQQELIVHPKVCYDLSGHCGFWHSRGECHKNPNFMAEVCQLTCKLCSEEDNEKLLKEETTGSEESDQHQQQREENDKGKDEL